MPPSEWERMNLETALNFTQLEASMKLRRIEMYVYGSRLVLHYFPSSKKYLKSQSRGVKAYQDACLFLKIDLELFLGEFKHLDGSESLRILLKKIHEAAGSMVVTLDPASWDLSAWPEFCRIRHRHVSELHEMLRAVSSEQQPQSRTKSQADAEGRP